MDLLRLYEYGPKRLSNKHTQSLNGFLKKENKYLRVFTSQRRRGVLGFCFAFVCFISCPITVTAFHPSQQNTAVFMTLIKCLNSISDTMHSVIQIQIPLVVYLYIRY